MSCDEAGDLPQGDLRGDEGQEIPFRLFRKPGVRGRPETFAQIRLISLENDGSAPLILDRVCLIAAPHRSPDVLGGQRVTKRPDAVLWPHWHGSDKGVVPLEDYRLTPNKAQLPYIPALDILIGPSNRPGRYACSENAALRVLYHTLDGKEWQRIYALAVEFPNHRGGTSAMCDKKYDAWWTYVAGHAVPSASP